VLPATLYDLRMYVSPSNIPNAGNGTFLEFMGARQLKQPDYLRSMRLRQKLAPRERNTTKPLQASFSDGQSDVTVFLKGMNLHGNKNRLYWPEKAWKARHPPISLTAVVPEFGTPVRVIVSEFLDEIWEDVLSDMYGIDEYDQYWINGSGHLQPVGHFGIHQESDYIRAPKGTKFHCKDNCINIGRYGPFRIQDRKAEDQFVLKGFIFFTNSE
jgi:hypothetical protein